jgi:hypothetical protein
MALGEILVLSGAASYHNPDVVGAAVHVADNHLARGGAGRQRAVV